MTASGPLRCASPVSYGERRTLLFYTFLSFLNTHTHPYTHMFVLLMASMTLIMTITA